MNEKSDNTQLQTVDRVARDLSDGLMLIDNQGTIQFINPSASRLLGNDALREGITYAEYMASDGNSANDAFHQYVLDCVYDKDARHAGAVTYTHPDGSVRYFKIAASYAGSMDGPRKSGVILRVTDITDLHLAKVKHDDTIKVLIGTITIMALWDYLVAVWEQMGRPISSTALTVIIEVIGVIATVFALRYTSITVTDFGLGTKNLKKNILVDSALTAAVLALMIVVKLFLRQFFPNIISPDRPFFRWDALQAVDLLYIPTVVLQEFLVRGVTQGSLERILPENYPPAVAIIVSSLVFGSIHIHKGLVFMVGAACLLCFFGFLYRKQGNIWGLCIPHLFLSWALRVIWG
jgi:PAS domain S-box-containing protein